ncbi:MAG: hypothetical protein ACETVW_04825 [Dehalococcoidia bacterium]
MATGVEHSAMAREIKKEYLMEHLEDIKRLIKGWISQLSTLNPFTPRDGVWNWQSGSSPDLERDQDSNHMLRRHLHSRALWSHHAEWERKRDILWSLKGRVQKLADNHYLKQLSNEQRKHRENYVAVALYAAFESRCSGKPLEVRYKTPHDKLGIALGNFKIELAASTADERTSIEKEHKGFINYLAKVEPMKELSALWQEIQYLEEQMRALANKALKSNDILYPCRFCKHLWK